MSRFKAEIRRKAEDRLLLACMAVQAQVVQNISDPTSALGPSRPGEFPHADTGTLRQHIYVAVGERAKMISGIQSRAIIGIVYTDLLYGLVLELGSSKMAPRPFLTRTLMEMQARVKSIIAGSSV